MSGENTWISSDGKIKKSIIKNGIWGAKPSECSECLIKIEDCTSNEINIIDYNSKQVIIGENDSNFGRLLDSVLQTMNAKETAKVYFKLGSEEINFILHLLSFTLKGVIYEWSAKEKYEKAVKHKEVGKELFKENRHIDASYRFGKALKLLCSIPIEIDEPPEEKDGINVKDIDILKINLYNNLASCYMKHEDYETVIELCDKIFKLDPDNVKALYKNGVAWYETHGYEKAQDNFVKLLKIEPNNKVALEKMKSNAAKLAEANAKVNAMVKRMFHT